MLLQFPNSIVTCQSPKFKVMQDPNGPKCISLNFGCVILESLKSVNFTSSMISCATQKSLRYAINSIQMPATMVQLSQLYFFVITMVNLVSFLYIKPTNPNKPPYEHSQNPLFCFFGTPSSQVQRTPALNLGHEPGQMIVSKKFHIKHNPSRVLQERAIYCVLSIEVGRFKLLM